jgi:uncharacterized surface protein with fasciclin (FAS1) repeats
MRTIKRIAATATIVSALALTAACGTDDSAGAGASGDANGAAAEANPSAPEDDAMMGSDGAPAADLVGPGCADYAEAVPDGAGSVQGMAQDPVATAASNNPLLKTLVAAVSGKLNPKVDLVDTLNGGDFTVFAPVDDAFAKLPKATVRALGTPKGADTLTSVLTYHVVAGRMSPDEVAGKTLKTVQGEPLEVTGSGDRLTAQDAQVICGGVRTANATVYLIDSVLMPPSAS